MQATAVRQIDGQLIRYDPDAIPEIAPAFFDPAWHAARGSLTGTAAGRGLACFLDWNGHQLVLRPFRRGGLVGRVIRDRYLRAGADRSRAFREYDLLAWMRAAGLPVPRPVAARHAPKGLFYRADLVTERIPDTQPLADVLATRALPPRTWADIGAAIARMHALGGDHTELNARNILLDGALHPWLIDFDKCRRRDAGSRVPGGWRAANLQRLKRSLVKERARMPGLHWAEGDWAALEGGYHATT